MNVTFDTLIEPSNQFDDWPAYRRLRRDAPPTGAPRFARQPGLLSMAAITSSTLKLEGFCRGGKSLNVSTNCATIA